MKKFNSIVLVLLLLMVPFTVSAQSYPRGDVNKDGSVNISDVTCLIDNLLRGISEGDVDQDGMVGIADVTCLIDYLLQGTWPDEPVTPPDDHEWVDLGLPSGTLWATMNVGASCPEDFGTYFAWGETEPKGSYGYETYKWTRFSINRYYFTKYCSSEQKGYNGFVDYKTVLDLQDDAAYVNWGPSWRMPSYDQMVELSNNCSWQWTTRNGVNGYLFTGPNGNTMFLPPAGVRNLTSLDNAGLYGYYWSRTRHSSTYNAWYLYFDEAHSSQIWCFSRINGCPVRAVRVP